MEFKESSLLIKGGYGVQGNDILSPTSYVPKQTLSLVQSSVSVSSETVETVFHPFPNFQGIADDKGFHRQFQTPTPTPTRANLLNFALQFLRK